jgi:hypothetical protein
VHPRGRRPRPRSQMAGKACEYCHTLRRSKALPPLNVQSTGQRTGHPAHATADSSIQGMSKETAPVEMRPGHGAGVPRQAVLASACVQEKIDYRMFPRKGTIWDYRYYIDLGDGGGKGGGGDSVETLSAATHAAMAAADLAAAAARARVVAARVAEGFLPLPPSLTLDLTPASLRSPGPHTASRTHQLPPWLHAGT